MSKKALRVGDYLQHMRDAADRVQRYTVGKSQDDFAADEQLQDAVVRNMISSTHPTMRSQSGNSALTARYLTRKKQEYELLRHEIELLERRVSAVP